MGRVEVSGRLAHAAGLYDGNQDMKVMQLHPKSDAIAQLHGGPPLQDRYVDIRTYHYTSMTASAIVSDEVRRQDKRGHHDRPSRKPNQRTTQ